MLRHVVLVRTNVSEEPSASIIRVTRIGEVGTLAQIATDELCEEIQSIHVPSDGVAQLSQRLRISPSMPSAAHRATVEIFYQAYMRDTTGEYRTKNKRDMDIHASRYICA
jgi:hypothetical protein